MIRSGKAEDSSTTRAGTSRPTLCRFSTMKRAWTRKNEPAGRGTCLRAGAGGRPMNPFTTPLVPSVGSIVACGSVAAPTRSVTGHPLKPKVRERSAPKPTPD